MQTATRSSRAEPWRRRLYLPAYSLAEAARYARISARTAGRWQLGMPARASVLSLRERGESLSYLELVELAVVAAFRTAGVSLERIQRSREFFAQRFREEFPFAHRRLLSEGAHVLMDLRHVQPDAELGKLVVADASGQLVWRDLIGARLKEFEYENDLALRWHVAGLHSPVIIDPRLSFGAPTVRGIATWAVKGRYEAGESVEEIAEDFGLAPDEVREAITFEPASTAA